MNGLKQNLLILLFLIAINSVCAELSDDFFPNFIFKAFFVGIVIIMILILCAGIYKVCKGDEWETHGWTTSGK